VKNNSFKINLSQIPKEAIEVIKTLKEKGFLAYLVGGCVRDFLLGKSPKDWDVTTSATPEKIQEIFKKTIYDNKYGTVKVIFKEKVIEVTPFRKEIGYSDRRHPDKVEFGVSLKEDLSRRDFTINALALDLNLSQEGKILDYKIIDYFGGLNDLEKKKIKAVGDADKRFQEDALRLLRAIRFAVTLDFEIEKETFEAIKRNAALIKEIAKERIRDEIEKIIMSPKPKQGFLLMHESGLLKYILPELEKGIGVTQRGHHRWDVFFHLLNTLQAAADRNYSFEVRLAALLHDIAKPVCRREEKDEVVFYGHQVVGAKMARKILKRLKFKNEIIEKVCLLIKHHMFVYEIGKVTERGVRRLLRKVGKENIQDLLNLRIADRIGSGCPKAVPYRLRHLMYMIEKVSSDPISLKNLKVNGNDVMEILKIKPSRKVGLILDALLCLVLDDPSLNKKEILREKIKELGRLSEEKLEEYRKRLDYRKKLRDLQLKSKYFVK